MCISVLFLIVRLFTFWHEVLTKRKKNLTLYGLLNDYRGTQNVSLISKMYPYMGTFVVGPVLYLVMTEGSTQEHGGESVKRVLITHKTEV